MSEITHFFTFVCGIMALSLFTSSMIYFLMNYSVILGSMAVVVWLASIICMSFLLFVLFMKSLFREVFL